MAFGMTAFVASGVDVTGESTNGKGIPFNETKVT